MAAEDTGAGPGRGLAPGKMGVSALPPPGKAPLPAFAFVERLNEQIAYEFAASQQYTAIAVHYDSQTLPRLADFFYRQALEEREHALMMVRYLLDSGSLVTVPGVEAPRTTFVDVVEPVALALEQERRVSDQINGLASVARQEGDLTSEQFMSWFIKEQVEEIATMSALFTVVERSRDNPMLVEDYLAREHAALPAQDPTAPPVAGA